MLMKVLTKIETEGFVCMLVCVSVCACMCVFVCASAHVCRAKLRLITHTTKGKSKRADADSN